MAQNRIEFTKMHGIGNDYIYIDGSRFEIDDPSALAIRLSDRHFGVGGDGIVLILPSEVADARMRMFNLDGSEGKMCGNAIRCVGKYLYENAMVVKPVITIETPSGVKTLYLTIEDGKVPAARVDMGKAELDPAKIPVKLDGEKVIDREIEVDGEIFNITCVSMGNPHAVIFVGEDFDLDGFEIEKIGPKIENHPLFPDRINVEFIKVVGRNSLKMRVWERGSGETLACGTGACASAVASVLNGHCDKGEDITVALLGGDLVINYTDETVFMTGGCTAVFDGSVLV